MKTETKNILFITPLNQTADAMNGIDEVIDSINGVRLQIQKEARDASQAKDQRKVSELMGFELELSREQLRVIEIKDRLNDVDTALVDIADRLGPEELPF
jgi:hypothetical protein